MTHTDIQTIYQTFQSSTPEQWNKISAQLTPEHRVLGKIARSSTPQQFEEFLKTTSLPTVKLTPQEMETLKGGAWYNIVSTAIALYSAYQKAKTVYENITNSFNNQRME